MDPVNLTSTLLMEVRRDEKPQDNNNPGLGGSGRMANFIVVSRDERPQEKWNLSLECSERITHRIASAVRFFKNTARGIIWEIFSILYFSPALCFLFIYLHVLTWSSRKPSC
jgi:hypothetical protein